MRHIINGDMDIFRSSSFNEMSPEKETRPVQRSSSCKEDHRSTRSRFDRSSERRKTCLPVLHPSPTDERPFTLSRSTDDVSLQVPGFVRTSSDPRRDEQKSAASGGKPDESDMVAEDVTKAVEDVTKVAEDVTKAVEVEEEGQVVTYNIGDERIEMEEGKVKRQTRGGHDDDDEQGT